jgi:Mg2+/citrate symporter
VFKDLNWGPAFKRAAIFVAIWLGLVYAMSVAAPDSFLAMTRAQIPSLIINAIMFFFLFAFIFAFTEKRRIQRVEQLKTQKKGKPDKSPADANGEVMEGSLRGQRNPNTSRKKARRKR